MKNLKEHLTNYCMHDVFDLYPINLTTRFPLSSVTINLFDKYSNITQELVLANSNMYYGYSDKVTIRASPNPKPYLNTCLTKTLMNQQDHCFRARPNLDPSLGPLA